MSIFFEIHKDIPREGPGDRASTRRAFQFLQLPHKPRVLDIGCGPGEQTMELAHLSQGSIIAVDLYETFLNEVNRRAIQEGVSESIQTVQASMFELDFPAESFDVIWSEGAIYIMGFANGLSSWRKFLSPGGYMVVSELSWLTDSPSEESSTFWRENYPGMKSVTENVALIEEAGYTPIQHFVLPEEAWWNDYYHPLEARVAALRPNYIDDEKAIAALNETQREIDLFRNYANEYGYVFYIMQKNQ